jgi:hypothetical protein
MELPALHQAIDREEAAKNPSSGRRPWEAFNSWRTRGAGTGRLNR